MDIIEKATKILEGLEKCKDSADKSEIFDKLDDILSYRRYIIGSPIEEIENLSAFNNIISLILKILINESDYKIRTEAIRFICRYSNKRDISRTLIQISRNDSNPNIRSEAISCLYKEQFPLGLNDTFNEAKIDKRNEELVFLLNKESNPIVLLSILKAIDLSFFFPLESVPKLVQIMKNSTDWQLRSLALKLLENAQEELELKDFNLFIQIVESNNSLVSDSSKETDSRAKNIKKIFENMGGIIERKGDKWEIFGGKISENVILTSKELLSVFKQLFYDTNTKIRLSIVYCLGEMGHEANDFANLLRSEMLKQDDPTIQYNYALALVKIEGIKSDGVALFRNLKKANKLSKNQIKQFEEYFKEQQIWINSSRKKTIFISYSWDNEDHKKWVRKLAENLAISGTQVYLDQWDLQLGDYLSEFMEKITIADYTLVILTSGYIKKLESKTPNGVKYEKLLIDSLKIRGINPKRIIPIVKDDNIKDSIPIPYLNKLYLNMSNDSSFESGIKKLLTHFEIESDIEDSLVDSISIDSPTNISTLNPKKLKAGSKEFFPPSIWEKFQNIIKDDLTNCTQCLINGLWTPAGIMAMRALESGLRYYYKIQIGKDYSKIALSRMLSELLSSAMIDRKLIGYLDYLRVIRNDLAHPNIQLDQFTAEQIFIQAVHALTVMYQ